MVKNGRRKGCQLYKCKSCGRRFVGGNRLKANDIISDYVEHKMTLSELSSKYHKSVSTIQRRLRQMRHVHVISKHKDVTVQMDTTYWGRNFGLMVIRDAVRGKILWHKYVRHETIADYVPGPSAENCAHILDAEPGIGSVTGTVGLVQKADRQ